MLYGGTAVAAIIACLYLLLRKGNAIAADITPPRRLRRWAAAFFAVTALGHIWWLLFYIFSWDIHSLSYILICLLDCMTIPATVYGTLLAMLQDRKRPLWPVVAAVTPLVIVGGLQIAWPDIDFTTPSLVYFLGLYAIFTIYMVIAVRQYGRWLRDNYADLENKEVWLTHTLILVFLLLIVVYGFTDNSIVMSYLVQFTDFILFGLLLWRVETLPQLDELDVVSKYQEGSLTASENLQERLLIDAQAGMDEMDDMDKIEGTDEMEEMVSQEADLLSLKAQTIPSNIRQLLDEHCVDTQLFLQHDLTLAQLSAAVGINRFYLSQYFSSLGMNYNGYINGLRVNYFISRYHEVVADHQSITAQQLADQSGFHSYRTFSEAFKRVVNQTVSSWMKEQR